MTRPLYTRSHTYIHICHLPVHMSSHLTYPPAFFFLPSSCPYTPLSSSSSSFPYTPSHSSLTHLATSSSHPYTPSHHHQGGQGSLGPRGHPGKHGCAQGVGGRGREASQTSQGTPRQDKTGHTTPHYNAFMASRRALAYDMPHCLSPDRSIMTHTHARSLIYTPHNNIQ